MEDAINASEPHARKKPFILFTLIQWIVALAIAFFALMMLIETDKLNLPDAPVLLFWTSFATASLVAIFHMPPLYFRIPLKAKLAAYASILLVFILFGAMLEQLDKVYSKTPEGAKEMAERQAENAKAAADEREREATAKAIAVLEKTKADLVAMRDKLESCFSSWGHRLPDLENPVRESLENPHAFEHVKTELIVPDEQQNDVEMTFRAENAFGALRTVSVRAQLVADGCVVQNIGSINSD